MAAWNHTFYCLLHAHYWRRKNYHAENVTSCSEQRNYLQFTLGFTQERHHINVSSVWKNSSLNSDLKITNVNKANSDKFLHNNLEYVINTSLKTEVLSIHFLLLLKIFIFNLIVEKIIYTNMGWGQKWHKSQFLPISMIFWSHKHRAWQKVELESNIAFLCSCW